MIKTNKQVGTFWTIFFAVIAVFAVGFAVYLGIMTSQRDSYVKMSTVTDENVYKISRENTYRQALYLACDGMKNMDANLGKAVVSDSPQTQAKLLTKVAICASQLNEQFGTLPVEASDKLMHCQKFVNQTGDYAQYLVGKLASGETLSAADKAALDSLDDVATNMYEFLQAYAEGDSGMFMTNGTGMGGVGSLSDNLNDVDDKEFAYEKLIYDGPFSDSVQKKRIRIEKSLTEKQRKAKLVELFGAATYVGAINGENKLFEYEVPHGRVSVTAAGDVCEYVADNGGEANSITAKQAIAAAEAFCAKLGYDVRGIWVSKNADYATYVNCAPVVDSAIVYPQLVKVAVGGNGKVIGVEAKAYLVNRGIDLPEFGALAEFQAKAKLADGLAVTNATRCIAESNGKLYACWQFECERDGRQYYVFIDSASGAEVDIFKVIKNTEGHTVM